MGNTQAREQRAPPPSQQPGSQPAQPTAQHNTYIAADGIAYTARAARTNHGGLFARSAAREEPQDEAALALRRQNKAEREERKKEEKEAARRRERERSMREESVDGGYLVSSGLYVKDEDYNKSVVRQLMVDRRLAPFFVGLNDHREDWAEHQLIAAVQGEGREDLDIPPADHQPSGVPHWPPADGPILAPDSPGPSQTAAQPSSPAAASPSNIRGRTKTPPPLSTSGSELQQPEASLPPQPLFNGQRLEVVLYNNPVDCEICYRNIPPYSNRSRCCDKPICTECFVSIKRKDPHPTEHESENSQPRPAEPPQNPDSEFDLSEIDLVSEPARCPFCQEEHFGVTYQPPPFRSGVVRAGAGGAPPPQSPLPSPGAIGIASTPASGRPRAASLPANAAGVVTTDKIRPDWARKLLQAKLNAAKRSRAATALHQQAFFPSSSRSRLGIFRRGNSDGITGDEEAEDGEGTPLDINGLIAAAADRRRGQPGLAGPRGRALAYELAMEADYEEALNRAIRESVEDEHRRAAKAEQERAEEERRRVARAEKEREEEERRKAKVKAKEDTKRAKDEAKLQKQADKQAAKAAKKPGSLSSSLSGSFLNFPRAMRSTTSVVSTGRRSSGSAGSRKGKSPVHDHFDATLGMSSGGASTSSVQLAGSGRTLDPLRSENDAAQTDGGASPEPSVAPRNIPSKSRSASQSNFGSLGALVEKPEDAKSTPKQEDADTGFGNFGRDMLSSMDDIMTGGGQSSSFGGTVQTSSQSVATHGVGSPAAVEPNSPTVETKRHEVESVSNVTTREFGSV